MLRAERILPSPDLKISRSEVQPLTTWLHHIINDTHRSRPSIHPCSRPIYL